MFMVHCFVLNYYAANGSGQVSPNTKVIFRSESAKYFIFLQLSREMLELDENGELYFDKAIFGFLPELFHRYIYS